MSFALKMMACQLLIEITRLLRDPPPQYNPFLPTFTSPTSTLQSTPRPSNVTVPVDLHECEDNIVRRSLDHPRSSAGSLEPGYVHGRSSSLEVPRNPLSDQSGDSGGEEAHIHKKSSSIDVVVLPETSQSSTGLKAPTSLSIKGPDLVPPSIVIGSPNVVEPNQRRFSLRRNSLGPIKSKVSPGISDKSPTSYLHRKLSNFRESFKKVRNVTKRSTRKTTASYSTSYSARTPGYSPLVRPSLSIGSSYKSLSDDPLCTNLPWINVISRLYNVDMFHDDSLSLHKLHCAELVAAIRRLYTLPPLDDDSEDTTVRPRFHTLSLGSDEMAYFQSLSLNHQSDKDKLFSISSYNSSILSSGTFSFPRFSRGTSLNLGSIFSRRQSMPETTQRETDTRVERLDSTSNKCFLNETELFGDDVDGALERHAMMLQSSKVQANDGKRIEYLDKEVKGLLHCPLTVIQLILAANLVESNEIPTLRDIAWQLLLDTNQDLVQSAG